MAQGGAEASNTDHTVHKQYRKALLKFKKSIKQPGYGRRPWERTGMDFLTFVNRTLVSRMTKGPLTSHARSAAALMSLRAEEGGYMRQRQRAAGNKN